MKAESINIQSELQKIHNQFGTTEMANYKIQQLFEKYAKDQIKKDRERIKEYLGEGVLITQINKVIDNTPIILD